MVVTATEFKNRVGKYMELAEKEEVIITKNGREVMKLVPTIKTGTPNADFLYGLLSDSENKDLTIKDIRKERLEKKHGSTD